MPDQIWPQNEANKLGIGRGISCLGSNRRRHRARFVFAFSASPPSPWPWPSQPTPRTLAGATVIAPITFAAPSYSPAFSSIIVDANSGSTLQATSADSLRHPASLTKIMTLYLLFEQLESGKMKLDSQMDVSVHASQQAPTKLGLKPGQTLRVEDAIKGLVTRSANDAAS